MSLATEGSQIKGSRVGDRRSKGPAIEVGSGVESGVK
jgi:hypothetical protein